MMTAHGAVRAQRTRCTIAAHSCQHRTRACCSGRAAQPPRRARSAPRPAAPPSGPAPRPVPPCRVPPSAARHAPPPPCRPAARTRAACDRLPAAPRGVPGPGARAAARRSRRRRRRRLRLAKVPPPRVLGRKPGVLDEARVAVRHVVIPGVHAVVVLELDRAVVRLRGHRARASVVVVSRPSRGASAQAPGDSAPGLRSARTWTQTAGASAARRRSAASGGTATPECCNPWHSQPPRRVCTTPGARRAPGRS